MRTTQRFGTGTKAAAALVLVASLAAACGGDDAAKDDGGSAAEGAAPSVLHLAFQADMQVPDPDIFYEGEGLVVMTSVYEGLVRYAGGSTDIEPLLATSYEISPDGLTYTFPLRTGVVFHDGTPMDSAAVAASFQRRTDVNSAPAYMLADVVSYDTSDPATLVIHLGRPIAAFMDYLASPWGPKVLSPKILTDEGGTDFAQTYLASHDAGTGPFTLAELALGDHYTLDRFDDYWGDTPAVEEIDIEILPDMTTQRLELEQGQLQMIMKGLTKTDVSSLAKDDSLQVVTGPSMFKSMIFVNQNRGPFADHDLRVALHSALDREVLTEAVYGDNATVSKQIYPAGQLPVGLAVDDPKLDTTALKSLAAALPDMKVDIGFTSDDSRNQQMADQVQSQLSALGLDATTRAMPLAIVFDLGNNPDQQPDLLISTQPPDGAHADTWIRPFMLTGAAVNFLQCSVPAADALADAGLVETDPAKADEAYGKAGDALVADGCFLPIADVKAVTVADRRYGNLVTAPAVPYTVRFGELTTAP